MPSQRETFEEFLKLLAEEQDQCEGFSEKGAVHRRERIRELITRIFNVETLVVPPKRNK